MTILLTGGHGMLGKALQDNLRQHNLSFVAMNKQTCDITNLTQLRHCIQQHRPTYIINCAAYTAVDDAEEDTERAFAINETGSKNLGLIAQEFQLGLIHISTDYVFDGTSTSPYVETAPTNPLSVYGTSKLKGEQALLMCCPTAKIVRTQWLYGPYGKNFVQTMLTLAKKYPALTVVDDQIGTPTYTPHLADALRRLMAHTQSGIFHVRNSGSGSWYDFAMEIFSQSNIDIKVSPVDSSAYPRPAARPKHSVLAMDRWHKELQEPPLPHWKEALQEYIDSDDQ